MHLVLSFPGSFQLRDFQRPNFPSSNSNESFIVSQLRCEFEKLPVRELAPFVGVRDAPAREEFPQGDE